MPPGQLAIKPVRGRDPVLATYDDAFPRLRYLSYCNGGQLLYCTRIVLVLYAFRCGASPSTIQYRALTVRVLAVNSVDTVVPRCISPNGGHRTYKHDACLQIARAVRFSKSRFKMLS